MSQVIINPNRNRLAAIMAKHGLKAIMRGWRINRSATPTRCHEIAESFCGRKFAKRDYSGMIAALELELEKDLVA